MKLYEATKVRHVLHICILTLPILIVTVFIASLIHSSPSIAADGSKFKAGHIIDDYVFYNSSSMNASQIQSFLSAKNPNCDTNGTQPASDWGRPDITHAQLAYYKRTGTGGYTKDTAFHAPPYVCLKNYTQNTPQMEAASGLCGGLSAKSNQSAAQIINDVAKACGINPQVLIVLLQKEQSLVTDTWPLNRQYRSATGFDCPDTAPCDPAFAGFFYQVYYAARQFKIYKAYPNDYGYIAGRTNRIYWHPDLSRCGSSNVYIKNQATAALYIYTPYRPNKAALDNLYGTGNSCSSYGNRNFWRMFVDWFGSTYTSVYKSMKEPRYLIVKEDTYKKYLPTLEDDNLLLKKDQLIYFDTVASINGVLYLRTKHDTTYGISRGIPITALREDVVFKPMKKPRYMRTADHANIIDPSTSDYITSVERGTDIFFTDVFTVGSKQYLRSSDASDDDLRQAVLRNDLEEIAPKHMKYPRYLKLSENAHKQSFLDLENDQPLNKDQVIYFDTLITINGDMFLRSKHDTAKNIKRGVAFTKLSEIDIIFGPLDTPRYMRINKDTHKIDPATQSISGGLINEGYDILITRSFEFNGTLYLQSNHDDIHDIRRGFKSSDVEDIPITSMKKPRIMKITRNIHKRSFETLEITGGLIKENRKVSFETSIKIRGEIYLRTEFDTLHGINRGIPLKYLEDL